MAVPTNFEANLILGRMGLMAVMRLQGTFTLHVGVVESPQTVEEVINAAKNGNFWKQSEQPVPRRQEPRSKHR